MKILVAGSRTVINYSIVRTILDRVKSKFSSIDTLISGAAAGVDYLAEQWAKENRIKTHIVLAKWNENGVYNKMAGIERNTVMVNMLDPAVDLCYIIWDGKSKECMDIYNKARKKKISTRLIDVSSIKGYNKL